MQSWNCWKKCEGFGEDLVLEGKTSRKQGLPKPPFWIVGIKDNGI